MTGVSNLFSLATRNLRQSGILVAFIAIVAFFAILNPTFLSPGNLTNIVLQYSYILILAIGMVIVIIAGHIDLSVGSVVALTGATAAVIVIRGQQPWWVGVLAAIAVGLLVGAWQGFWVAYVGIPAFIVTLAGMLLFRGLTFIVLSNVSLSPFGGTYYSIANGFINGLFGGYGVDVFTLVIFAIGVVGYAVWQVRSRRSKLAHQQSVEALGWFVAKIAIVAAVVMWFGYQLSTSRGLPFVLIILAVLIIAYSVITQKSVFGRHVYAIGGNLHAALLSGVNVQRVNFWIFVNMGMLAGIAGVVFSSRTNGAQPGAGNMFELDAIAACFIGGAAVTGGVGRVGGAIVGGLIMAVMSNGMQLMGLDQATQQVVKGLVLLIAVAFDVWNKRRAGAAR
ncbi:sugar ABC transporter permease [Microbacterium foliorum]|jgi:putative multiple sugar transport system permease protein|uniref:Xylose transport system permease protein XylH n=1 Tax=Microbacterium foliorum TaxID=104336 RepID=A0A0F0L2V7_9MICO|nr:MULTISPECIES: multiple monosaccharide ABC transporter permease [Microbacterium]AXL13516.1 sugar ABC transporter permease [Microbacterium foliorum]KAA0962137.1 sugar ABC transporter permease [Microbacterium sp. ANT_H45B]KJL25841.1 Xylose transport system permease protein XylH [Microbacterium foliorum]KQZ23884.1 ABC transporter permease [Microbacterium sp. Root553]CAH0227926.1 Xylose transport system permease protein XylH [Microbacterium foliorum]